MLVADPWLSERLGKPAFHVDGKLDERPAEWSNFESCLPEGPVFIDAKIEVHRVDWLSFLTRVGFSLIDTNLHFSLPRNMTPVATEGLNISFARPDMVDMVTTIAGTVLVHDRFHRDSRIPAKAATEIKRLWARNFFNGKRGDWMVVALQSEQPVGFLQLLRGSNDSLVIDLIGVSSSVQKQGLARSMIAFAANHCGLNGDIVVGTQIANTPSVRFYEALGFRLSAAQYVLHFHGRE